MVDNTKNQVKAQASVDELLFASNMAFKKNFESDERVLTSLELVKVNKNGKKQKRSLLVTNRYLYNLKGTTIQRKISVLSIKAMILSSSTSGEFVLNVPGEYDYHYISTSDKTSRIAKSIADAIKEWEPNCSIHIYMRPEESLVPFISTKKDMEKQISKLPKEPPLTYEEFCIEVELADTKKKLIDLKKTTKIAYSHDANQIGQVDKLGLYDFKFSKVLGDTELVKTILAIHQSHQYVLKIFLKSKIYPTNVKMMEDLEKNFPKIQKIPNVVAPLYVLSDSKYYTVVLPFYKGGSLSQHLRIAHRFPDEKNKPLLQKIIPALEALHGIGVTVPNLRPDNIILDEKGEPFLDIVGLQYLNLQAVEQKKCIGNPEYFSPETLKGTEGCISDFWRLGCLVFEIYIGITPFFHENPKMIFQQIKSVPPRFPAQLEINAKAKDLIKALLNKEGSERLGNKGWGDVKGHPYFSDINWSDPVLPGVVPKFMNEDHMDYFSVEMMKKVPYKVVGDMH